MTDQKKKIFVIGATGAQGRAVIEALLKKSENSESFNVIALTRDKEKAIQKWPLFNHQDVEVIQGELEDMDLIFEQQKGVYGAFINIDTFSVGEIIETWAGCKIFELAKAAGVKHYVWSSLDHMLAQGNFNRKYAADHYAAKSRVSAYMRSIPSAKESSRGKDKGLVWTSLVTGPYTEMLTGGPFNPQVNPEKNASAAVFRLPLGPKGGLVPFVTLDDIAYFSRWIFDHPNESSGRDIVAISHPSSGHDMAEAYTKATGNKATYEDAGDFNSFAEGLKDFINVDAPLANTGGSKTTYGENFKMWYQAYADGVIKRDEKVMEEARTIRPDILTLEEWMKRTKYTGKMTSIINKSWPGPSRQA